MKQNMIIGEARGPEACDHLHTLGTALTSVLLEASGITAVRAQARELAKKILAE